MDAIEFDLSVGDVLCLGNQTVTVVDIDGPHVSFRIDREDDLVGAAAGEVWTTAGAFDESD